MAAAAGVALSQAVTRLVVAEPLTLLREGLAAICESSPCYEVLGQCGDGTAALKLIFELVPDIALLDINLPGLHTLEIIQRVKAGGLPTKTAVLSPRGDRKTVIEALRGGASAFLLKSGPAVHLLESFEQMRDGGVYISPELKIDEIFLSPEKAVAADPFETLGPREFQVFNLLIEGLRPKEIAARLNLSPKTIDTYRAGLMQKLDIHDIASLVRFAMHRDMLA